MLRRVGPRTSSAKSIVLWYGNGSYGGWATAASTACSDGSGSDGSGSYAAGAATAGSDRASSCMTCHAGAEPSADVTHGLGGAAHGDETGSGSSPAHGTGATPIASAGAHGTAASAGSTGATASAATAASPAAHGTGAPAAGATTCSVGHWTGAGSAAAAATAASPAAHGTGVGPVAAAGVCSWGGQVSAPGCSTGPAHSSVGGGHSATEEWAGPVEQPG